MYFAASHVLSYTKHLEVVHQRGPFFLELVQMLWAVGVGRMIVDHFPPPRNPSPVVPLAVICHIGEARLEALEEGIGIVILGNVLEHIIGNEG